MPRTVLRGLPAPLLMLLLLATAPLHAQVEDGFLAKDAAPAPPPPAAPVPPGPQPEATVPAAPPPQAPAATPAPSPAPGSDILDPGAPLPPSSGADVRDTPLPEARGTPIPNKDVPGRSPSPSVPAPRDELDDGCVGGGAACFRPAGPLHDTLGGGRWLGVYFAAMCLPLGGLWLPILLAPRGSLAPPTSALVRTVLFNSCLPWPLGALGPIVGTAAWVVTGIITAVALAALYFVVFGVLGMVIVPSGGQLLGVAGAAWGAFVGFFGGGSGFGIACCLLCGLPGLITAVAWQLYVLPLTTVRAWNTAAHLASEEPRKPDTAR